MKLFIIKGKYIFLAILAAIILCIVIGTVGTKPVFLVGNREIPIYSVKRDDNKLSLTFNCAWNDDDIDSILKTLDAYSVKCTFFIVGEWAQKYPESVKRIAEHGHELANHSYSHAHYSKLDKAAILSDIEKCDNLIYDISGQKPVLFRAAYGEYNDNVVKACDESGRTYIQWSIDSLDYKNGSVSEIYNRIVPKAKSGDIILMHNGTEKTAAILPEILAGLTKEYTLCPVSELIYSDNYIIDGTGMQIKSGS